jgi:hypothetical protein
MKIGPIGSVVLGVLLGFAGCARDELRGAYEDEVGVARYEFMGNGRVHISVLGTTVLAEYRLDNDTVTVSGPQGALVLTRRNGELHGPMGLVLVRREP